MNNGKTRRKSPLASYERISPNKRNPRESMIRRSTPHHIVGNLSIEASLGLSQFITDGGSASTSYVIGSDGRLGLGVEETMRPYTTSSSINDREAITCELSNIGGAPDWRISDVAINMWMDFTVEAAKFYGFKTIKYVEKPANLGNKTENGKQVKDINAVETWIKTWSTLDDFIITVHQWYSFTVCPGPYLMRQLPWMVKEMQKRLNGMSPEKFVGEGSVPIINPTSPTNVNNTSYPVTISVSALNVRKGPGTNYEVVTTLVNDKNTYTIVDEVDGPGASKWCKLKSGIGWVSKDHIKKK